MDYARKLTPQEDDPRTARTLEYRPRLLKMVYWATLGCCLAIVLGIVYLRIDSNYSFHGEWTDLFILFPLALMWQVHSFIYPLLKSKAHVSPNQIALESKDGSHTYLFENIASFDANWNSQWLKIKFKNGEELRLSLMLERSEYVVDAISKFNSKFAESPLLQKYRADAILLDHFYARMSEFLKSPKNVALGFFVFPLLETGLYAVLRPSSQGVDPSDSYGRWWLLVSALFILNAFVGGVTWVVAEHVIQEKARGALKKDPQALRRDMPFEKKVHRIQFRAYVALMIVSTLILVLIKII